MEVYRKPDHNLKIVLKLGVHNLLNPDNINGVKYETAKIQTEENKRGKKKESAIDQ